MTTFWRGKQSEMGDSKAMLTLLPVLLIVTECYRVTGVPIVPIVTRGIDEIIKV